MADVLSHNASQKRMPGTLRPHTGALRLQIPDRGTPPQPDDAPLERSGAALPRGISAGVLRTLRVLELLTAQSDEEHFINSGALIQEIEHPSSPGTPATHASRGTIYLAVRTLRLLGYNIASNNSSGYALVGREFSRDEMNQVLRAVSRYPKLDARERLDLTRHLQTLCTPTHRAELACGAAHAAGEAEATHALRFCLASPMAIARVAAREQGDLYFELTSCSEGLPHSRRRRLTAPTLRERGGIWFVAGQERMPRLGSTSWRMVRLDRLANLATFSESGTVYVHPFAPKASPQSAGGRQG